MLLYPVEVRGKFCCILFQDFPFLQKKEIPRGSKILAGICPNFFKAPRAFFEPYPKSKFYRINMKL
jgi:hypothetical protein